MLTTHIDRAGGPLFDAVGDTLLRHFPVGKLSAPQVAWLNRRFFLEAGIDIDRHEERAAIGDWLLSNFAVSSAPALCANSLTDKLMGADLYGGSLGTLHGGSGRAGCVGRYNAKGIGPTPLVSFGVDWSHSHGFLYLYDAIREAIAGEILNAELPHGAVPVVAIIDTGCMFSDTEGAPPEPCGILVRPNFFRIAHLERSTFFGSAGTPHSDQYRDAKRVEAVVRHVNDLSVDKWDGYAQPNAATMLRAVARQVGAGRAHRLWNGRPLTDNLAIDGRVLDFGGFRTLPNWKAADDCHGQIFGREMEELAKAAHSITHYIRKYSPRQGPQPSPGAVIEVIKQELSSAFSGAVASACGFEMRDSVGQEIAGLMQYYYHRQQSDPYYLDDLSYKWNRRDWIYYDIKSSPESLRDPIAAATLSALLRAKSPRDDVVGSASLAATLRWLQPRPSQYYHISKAQTRRFIARNPRGSESYSSNIETFITTQVALARRVWKIKSDNIVIGYSTDLASESLFTYDVGRHHYAIILRAPLIDGSARVFGQRLDSCGARVIGAQVEFDPINLEHPMPLERGCVVNIAGTAISIPPAQSTFADALNLISNLG